jgi:anthranilate phosphoribosyltransferase
VINLRQAFEAVLKGRSLDAAEAESVMGEILDDVVPDALVAGFLIALRLKGESAAELTGGVRAMRRRSRPLSLNGGNVLDTAGTGGDGAGTFNISTAAALLVAGCGVPVAKHGNRNFSSKSGSADILQALGVNIDADMSLIRRSMFEAGIGFLMAPRHHSATRHVAPTRVELGTRTIFNLLGPISNPAGAKRQLVGVFAPAWCAPIAEVLGKLGSERAWVVHGEGMDEITTAGTTQVAQLDAGKVTTFEVTPEDAGLPRARIEDLRGGEPAENAAKLLALLGGEKGPLRDIVLLNAAAALIVAGKVSNLRAGVERAAQAIADGSAKRALDRMIAVTNEHVPA